MGSFQHSNARTLPLLISPILVDPHRTSAVWTILPRPCLMTENSGHGKMASAPLYFPSLRWVHHAGENKLCSKPQLQRSPGHAEFLYFSHHCSRLRHTSLPRQVPRSLYEVVPREREGGWSLTVLRVEIVEAVKARGGPYFLRERGGFCRSHLAITTRTPPPWKKSQTTLV